MMPRKSGVSLYQCFKEDDRLKSTPVIIISGIGSTYGDKSRLFRKLFPGKELDIEAFFQKPLDVEKFLKYLGSLFAVGEQ